MSLRKFFKYILLGFCLIFLATFAQLGNLAQRGPSIVSADEDDCIANNNCGNPGTSDVVFPAPDNSTPAAPAPAQPAAPAPNCQPVFQGNECIACNTSNPVYTDSCDGHFTWGSPQSDSQCASWCSAPAAPAQPAQPAAPANPTCTPNDQLYTERRCQPGTTQMCTYNRWKGTDCSEGWGGAYNCQNDTSCGYSTPPAAAPSCSNGQTGGTCGDGAHPCGSGGAGRCDACNGGWCNGGQCSTCSPPAAPAAPSCSNGQTGGTCGDGAHPCGSGGAGRCDACNGGWCNGGQCSTCSPPAGGPVACVPNGSCSAPAPSCGQTTTGVDNCGNSCSKQGGACGCIPNGSCSAPAPSCGQTTTGVDNCGNSCTKAGSACQATPGPASCDFSPRYVNTNIGVNTGFSATYNPGTNSNRVASSYTWTFGDNSGSFPGSYATHIYSTTGNYPINLTITANTGESVTCSGSANIQSNNQCRSITCPTPAAGCSFTGQITYTCDPNVALTCGTQTCNNQNLICTITASPQSGTSPLNVTLNGNATGGSGSYTYSWDTNGNASYGDAVTQSTSKIYNTSTNVSLKVTDAANSNLTAICYSNINVTTPVVGQGYCTLTASPSNVNTGGSVNLTATYNPNGSNTTAQSYSYNFGDGVTSSTGTHVYQQAGNYYPSVTVTDNLGRQVNCSSFVSVNPPQGAVVPPPATFVNVGVGTSATYYYAGVQQLPKTGLPALAWVAGAFLPAGMGFKRFGKVKKSMENHPSYIWEKRQFRA